MYGRLNVAYVAYAAVLSCYDDGCCSVDMNRTLDGVWHHATKARLTLNGISSAHCAYATQKRFARRGPPCPNEQQNERMREETDWAGL